MSRVPPLAMVVLPFVAPSADPLAVRRMPLLTTTEPAKSFALLRVNVLVPCLTSEAAPLSLPLPPKR